MLSPSKMSLTAITNPKTKPEAKRVGSKENIQTAKHSQHKTDRKRFPLSMNRPMFRPTTKTVRTKLADESTIVPEVFDVSKPKVYVKLASNPPKEDDDKVEITLRPNSRRRLEKEMRQVEAMTITDCYEPYEDKVTRLVNFPAEKKIYRNLIPLATSERKRAVPSNVTYEFSVRENEPKLDDYYIPEATGEYAATARVVTPGPSATKQYDGLITHRRMKTWKPATSLNLDGYLEHPNF